MSRTERLSIRISPELKEKVETVAKERNITVSELIVDYIKRLPHAQAALRAMTHKSAGRKAAGG